MKLLTYFTVYFHFWMFLWCYEVLFKWTVYFFWIIECPCGFTYLDCCRVNILCNSFYEDKLTKVVVTSLHLTPVWILESWTLIWSSLLHCKWAQHQRSCPAMGDSVEALLSDLKRAQAFLGSPALIPNVLPGATLPPCVQTGKWHR